MPALKNANAAKADAAAAIMPMVMFICDLL
jgi:hypothetical protein